MSESKQISQKEARQYKKALAELSESVLVFLWRMDEVFRWASTNPTETIKNVGKRMAHLGNALDIRNDQVRNFTLGLPIDFFSKDKAFKKAALKAGREDIAADSDLATKVEREQARCVSLIRLYLQFNDQRSVSWHEIEDCIKAIRQGEAYAPAPYNKETGGRDCQRRKGNRFPKRTKIVVAAKGGEGKT